MTATIAIITPRQVTLLHQRRDIRHQIHLLPPATPHSHEDRTPLGYQPASAQPRRNYIECHAMAPPTFGPGPPNLQSHIVKMADFSETGAGNLKSIPILVPKLSPLESPEL